MTSSVAMIRPVAPDVVSAFAFDKVHATLIIVEKS